MNADTAWGMLMGVAATGVGIVVLRLMGWRPNAGLWVGLASYPLLRLWRLRSSKRSVVR